MRRLIVGLASLITVIGLGTSTYAEVIYDVVKHELTISGPTTIWQAQAAVSILESQDVKTVVMYGPGGDGRAIPFLGDRILEEKVRVVIPEEEMCASACAYIATGASVMDVQGQLLFHRAHYPSIPGLASLDEIGGRYAQAHLRMMKWWSNTGFTFDHMINMAVDTDTCNYVTINNTEQFLEWKNKPHLTQKFIVNICEG